MGSDAAEEGEGFVPVFGASHGRERSDQLPAVGVGAGQPRVQHGDDETRFRVGQALIADAEQRLRLWRTLQELAGVVTPFTKQVREAAERDVAQSHEAALAQLKSEYEAKLAQLRAEYDADATRRVTDGLLALAGYDSNGEQGEGDAT